ncbi:protein B4 [Cololabis saira]|uniref:protein B4 n=1 Tax=Cololabis saira TaxID=129043 RepID=UPI002AD3A4D0|nr:protein B4 [Cololabis saira]
MPPKKTEADSPDAPQSPDTPVEKMAEKEGAAAVRKPATHPSTAIMVGEALKELDSRKGVSNQAIQGYIKQKYPEMDPARLKSLVRKALIKGLESGTMVRPANAADTISAVGKFRLAPKVKESKPKTENVDPNVGKVPKDGVKKPKTAGVSKKKSSADADAKISKPLKKSKKESAPAEPGPEEPAPAEPGPSKSAPPKRPKAKKAEVQEGDEGSSDATKTKTKVAKTVKEPKSKVAKEGSDGTKTKTKVAKTVKEPQSEVAKEDDDGSSSKATSKRGKKT